MSTIIDDLKKGNIPDFIKKISADESIDLQELIRNVINGHVVICRNNLHSTLNPIAIGKGTRIKVNANIGTSPTLCDFSDEMDKVNISIDSGADTLMDLSISGNISGFRKKIIEEFDITLGTVIRQILRLNIF